MTAKQIEEIEDTRENLELLANKVISIYSKLTNQRFVAEITEKTDVQREFERILEAEFNITLYDLKRKSRKRLFVSLRHSYCYIMSRKTSKTLGEIGYELGGQDHSTIIHAIKKASDNIEINDENFCNVFKYFKHLLN